MPCMRRPNKSLEMLQANGTGNGAAAEHTNGAEANGAASSHGHEGEEQGIRRLLPLLKVPCTARCTPSSLTAALFGLPSGRTLLTWALCPTKGPLLEA